MGQSFSAGAVVGGGTTAPPYLATHTVAAHRVEATEWKQQDDRDWLKTPSPAPRAEAGCPTPSLASLMGMAGRTQSASELHRRVAMTRRFTQLQAQLSTGSPSADSSFDGSPSAGSPRPIATTEALSATTTVSANSVASGSSSGTTSSSGSDYSECLDDGRPHGTAVRMPPVPPSAASTPSARGLGLRLSPSSGPQLPGSPSSTPGSKIPVLSPQVAVSARKAAFEEARDEANGNHTPVKEWLAARGLDHYVEAFVSFLSECDWLRFAIDSDLTNCVCMHFGCAEAPWLQRSRMRECAAGARRATSTTTLPVGVQQLTQVCTANEFGQGSSNSFC
jgi:hypothetical protein